MSTLREPESDEMLAEALKDFAHDHGLRAIQAQRVTGPSDWTTVEVAHASILSDSADGWDVTIRRESL